MLIPRMFLAAAFLSFSALTFAQYGPAVGPYQPDSVTGLVDRVHSDLNRGYGEWKVSKGDRDRLNNADKQLREFDHDWRKGKFDKGDLDDAISAIQHVLDNNHLTGGARDAISSDIQDLRHMREAYDRHEIGRW